MSNYAIQVQNLSKEYIIGGAEQRHDSFREMLTGALTSPLRKLRKLGGTASEEERFWALKDVSFNVEQGEVLGIIGRNGAGKSTLLKVLSRITSPTEGRVITRGRVASLLEVGTGFHPELTGRENIYLNGAILGMSRAEIDRQFDEIVAFAEIEKFLDTPVKRYSSGMYVRLAFAVAAHLEPEILLVDEVLAVGDTQFQKKCLGKMSSVAAAGRTVLFVSHNMNAIRRLCRRSVLVRNGQVSDDGATAEVLDFYLNSDVASAANAFSLSFAGPLGDRVKFTEVTTSGSLNKRQQITFESPIFVTIKGFCVERFDDLEIAIGISREGLRVFSGHDSHSGTAMQEGYFESQFAIEPGQLHPGRYELSCGANRRGRCDWCWAENAIFFDIESVGLSPEAERDFGIVSFRYEGTRKQ